MSLNHSPKIVTDGLVFAYDMSNTQKSWKGAPTTNLIDVSENLLDAKWTKEGGFGTVTANYGNAPDGTKTSTRLQYSSGYFYRSTTTSPAITALTPGTIITFSCWVKGTAQPGRGIGLWSYAVGGIVAASSQSISPNSWTRVSITYTIAAGATSFAITLAGAPGNIFQGDIEVWRPQLEVKNFATAYTNGTRSNTQAVLDLTGRRTITIAGTPTYGTDGTFNFNSSGSTTLNLGSGSNFLPMPSLTLEAWVKTPGLGAGMTINGIWGFTYGIRVDAYSNGSVAFVIGTDVTTFVNIGTTGVNINDNAWHHIVAVKSGDTYAAIYVDGVVRASAIPVAGWSGTNPWAAMEIQIGRDQNNLPYYFNGRIDSAKVYNTGLSATEVQQNFNALRGRYS